MPASAASSRAFVFETAETAFTSVQWAPLSSEYHQDPFVVDVAVRAIPVTAPLSASVTLSSPLAGGLRSTRLETSVPTAPTGAPASSFSAASTGVAALLRTGASFTGVTLTVIVFGRRVEIHPAIGRAAVVLHLEGEAGVAVAVGIGRRRELQQPASDVGDTTPNAPEDTATAIVGQRPGPRQRRDLHRQQRVGRVVVRHR